jgi:hypothetical protein
MTASRTRGYLRIAVYPDRAGPLDLTLRDANGKPLDASIPLRTWPDRPAPESWTSGIEIDCPRTHLAGWDGGTTGVLYVGIADPERRRNFYDLDIEYHEAKIFGVDRGQFPHPVWELDLIEFLDPGIGPVARHFPQSPDMIVPHCPSTPCVTRPARYAIAWAERGDFEARFALGAPADLSARLYGADGPVGEPVLLSTRDRLHVTDLAPGLYLLELAGTGIAVPFSIEVPLPR